MKTYQISTNFYGRHILNEAISVTKSLYTNTVNHPFIQKTMSWLQWLVQPEQSETDYPISFSKQSSKMIDTVKIIFWLIASIVIGLLIGQL